MVNYKPNFKELDKLSDEGYLRKVISPCQKLVLYNYTDLCTFEKKWNEHTLNARGNVYEISTGKVVARAFPKFFNFSELSQDKQQEVLNEKWFQCYEKLDGSLGIIYFYDGEWRVNTRGSFTSDQAIKAKSLLLDMTSANTNFTYLVEIIYPENKIIANYGKQEKLVQLAAFDTDSGTEINVVLNQFHEVAYKISGVKSIHQILNVIKTLPYDEEGYVVRLQNGERIKFKGDEYLKLARMISRLSPLVLWENMANGRINREFLQGLPEEFRDDYESMSKTLEKQYKSILKEATDTTKSIALICNNTNKEIGLYLSRNEVEYSELVFPIFLGKQDVVEKLIMKLIRPTGNQMNESV